MKPSALIRTSVRGVAFAALALSGAAQAASPIAQLLEATGTVEYSRDGERWRPVSRAKYLFEGYRVRTAPGASAVVVNATTGLTRSVGPDTVIAVDAEGARVVRGSLAPVTNVAARED